MAFDGVCGQWAFLFWPQSWRGTRQWTAWKVLWECGSGSKSRYPGEHPSLAFKIDYFGRAFSSPKSYPFGFDPQPCDDFWVEISSPLSSQFTASLSEVSKGRQTSKSLMYMRKMKKKKKRIAITIRRVKTADKMHELSWKNNWRDATSSKHMLQSI